MRSGYIDAAAAQRALWARVAPAVDVLTRSLPPIPATLRAAVIVQAFPPCVRFVVTVPGAGQALEAGRLYGDEVPAGAELEEAVGAFVAAGLSAMPDAAVDGAMTTAARPGGGFVVVLDPLTHSARCVLVPKGRDIGEGMELFAIVSETNGETTH